MAKNDMKDIFDKTNSGQKGAKGGNTILGDQVVEPPDAIPAMFLPKKEISLNVEGGKAWKNDADTRAMDETPDDALSEFAGVTKFSVRSSLVEGGMGSKGGASTAIPQEGGPDSQRGKPGSDA